MGSDGKTREEGSNGKLVQVRKSRKKICVCISQIRKLDLRKAKCPAQPVSPRLGSELPQDSSLRVRNCSSEGA